MIVHTAPRADDSDTVAWVSPNAGPRAVFAQGESTGSSKQIATTGPILIVEDDFLVSMEIEAALADAGFEIAGVAVSAEEAVELALEKVPILVIMDIRLAGKRDGVDAALELFRKQGIRCIFATAYHDPATRGRAEPAAPLAWLPKPYTMLSLVDTIRRALAELGAGKA
ncbi:MAG: response regulator [Xanthobacteraceae bacterium]|nr:response regulator [Xanthobacteraceae bacterium]MBV9235492.1 response regulator [Xanthobacteraceae bacterium]MBV9629020.1 response regulator [Xanthobacteraceae bacterium]